MIEGLTPKIELLTRRLKGMADQPHVGDIRQRGLMVGIELVQDKESRGALPGEPKGRAPGDPGGPEVGGHPAGPWGTSSSVMPPLSITLEELETLARITREAITRGSTST